MKSIRYKPLTTLMLLAASAALLSGCLLGYPARSKVTSVEIASRVGSSSNIVDRIIARYTYNRCIMLLTPEGAMQEWVHSVDRNYVLQRADGSEVGLPFLRGHDWKKLLPLSSTNLWVAISQPERKQRQDILYVVVFRDDSLLRKRSLKTLALGPDGHYKGFLAFSQARWVIWYPTEQGQEQYDILRDKFIWPLDQWGEAEGQTLMWMPGDAAPPPP